MTFHQPSAWFLLLLLVLPLLWWRWRRAARERGIAFSSAGPLRAAGTTWAVRFRWIVPALRSAAIAVLVVCLARPQEPNVHTRIYSEGVAIQLLIDRSVSMLAEDFQIDGRRANRLAAVKKVVEDFIDGGDALPGRPDDLVGLIRFGTFADSACPLTLDHEHLIETVRATEVAEGDEGATAIGDAIALGVERIHQLERRAELASDRKIKSRVMILLTDGENTAGDIDPLVAAEMAASFGIKVHTIAAGSRDSSAPVPVRDPLTGRRRLVHQPVSIDEETLRKIAEATGGEHFRATDSDSLVRVYGAIDELERTEIEQRRYTEYRELSVAGTRVGGVPVPSLLSVVFALLATELLLSNTRFRRLP